MNKHSVIFIENPEVEYEKLNRSESFHKKNKLISYFLVSPSELPYRIFSSFVPPVLGEASRRVYVDLIGPLVGLVLLACVLQYGHINKHPSAVVPTSPIVALFYYILIVPSVCLFSSKLGKANLSPHKILALLGYGLYGHLFTVSSSLFIDGEASNTFFFVMMTIFGGLSCFRIVLVLLLTIGKPPARLLICTLWQEYIVTKSEARYVRKELVGEADEGLPDRESTPVSAITVVFEEVPEHS